MLKHSANWISLFNVAVNRLIVIALLCLAPFLSALAINPGYSGTWYYPAQDGHGFSIEISEFSDGTPVGIVIWYIYDDQGNPIFLAGSGEPNGDKLNVRFHCPSGMEFGVFDPLSVIREDGGTGRLEFTDENSATFEYTPSAYMEQELGHSPISIPLVKLLDFPSPESDQPPAGQYQYKDLVIGVTTQFNLMMNDWGYSYEPHVRSTFWEPIVPEDMTGFYPVGDLALRGDWKTSAIALVKDAEGDCDNNGDGDCWDPGDRKCPDPETGVEGDLSEYPALCPASKWIAAWWHDYLPRPGGGVVRRFVIWHPIPPEGYRCLGAIAGHHDDSFTKDGNKYRCVRSDLVVPASLTPVGYYPPSDDDFSQWIWHSYPHANPVAAWGIVAPEVAPEEEIYLAPGTFAYSINGHDRESALPIPMAFRLPITATFDEDKPRPLPPPLESVNPTHTDLTPVETASFTLPWFAVNDPNLTPISRLAISPTYTMRRYEAYKPVQWAYNQTEADQTVTWTFVSGTHGSESETFTEETGWSLGGEVGFKIGTKAIQDIFSFSASATHTRTFTHTEVSTSGWEEKVEFTLPVTVPAGTAVIAWVLESDFRLYNKDGVQVSVSVPYTRDQIVFDQFPRFVTSDGTASTPFILKDVLKGVE